MHNCGLEPLTYGAFLRQLLLLLGLEGRSGSLLLGESERSRVDGHVEVRSSCILECEGYE